MAWNTPQDPVSGTVITVAYARANILDPIRWLRLMAGNADPPGSSYALVSDSTTVTHWGKILTDLIADGAVTTPKILDGNVTAPKLAPLVAQSNLGFPPVNKLGDTMSGTLTLQQASANALTLLSVQNLGAGGSSGAFIGFLSGGFVSRIGHQLNVGPIVCYDGNGSEAFRVDGATGHAYVYNQRIWDAGNDGPGSGLDADTVDGRNTGSTAGTIPVYDANGRVADSLLLNGQPASFYASAASVPGSIPAGIVAMVRTAAETPSGWVRETRLDGRMPVGAGTASGMTVPATYVEDQDYGASWAHVHNMSSHTHDVGGHTHSTPNHVHPTPVHAHATPVHSHAVGALTVAGATGQPSATAQASTTAPTTAFAAGSHTHDQGTLDVGGSISGDGGGNTNGTDGATTNTMTSSGSGTTGNPGVQPSAGPAPGNTSTDPWQIPSHAYVFIRKT